MRSRRGPRGEGADLHPGGGPCAIPGLEGHIGRDQDLFDEWKRFANWHTPKEDELWERFKRAKDTFYDRRSGNFREMDGQREQNRLAKQALIAEAREVVQSDEWKATGDALQELFGRWKEVGSAGRDYDEDLWADFNGIRQDFFERRHQYYEERDREFETKAERKGAIVQEAATIAARCDYSSEVANGTTFVQAQSGLILPRQSHPPQACCVALSCAAGVIRIILVVGARPSQLHLALRLRKPPSCLLPNRV